jgi:hypothetical protein
MQECAMVPRTVTEKRCNKNCQVTIGHGRKMKGLLLPLAAKAVVAKAVVAKAAVAGAVVAKAAAMTPSVVSAALAFISKLLRIFVPIVLLAFDSRLCSCPPKVINNHPLQLCHRSGAVLNEVSPICMCLARKAQRLPALG